jgi:hypothetical protein
MEVLPLTLFGTLALYLVSFLALLRPRRDATRRRDVDTQKRVLWKAGRSSVPEDSRILTHSAACLEQQLLTFRALLLLKLLASRQPAIFHNTWIISNRAEITRNLTEASLFLSSSVFWVIAKREVVWTRCYGSIFKVQASWKAWPLKMGPIGSPETSVSTTSRFVITHKREEAYNLFVFTVQ